MINIKVELGLDLGVSFDLGVDERRTRTGS